MPSSTGFGAVKNSLQLYRRDVSDITPLAFSPQGSAIAGDYGTWVIPTYPYVSSPPYDSAFSTYIASYSRGAGHAGVIQVALGPTGAEQVICTLGYGLAWYNGQGGGTVATLPVMSPIIPRNSNISVRCTAYYDGAHSPAVGVTLCMMKLDAVVAGGIPVCQPGALYTLGNKGDGNVIGAGAYTNIATVPTPSALVNLSVGASGATDSYTMADNGVPIQLVPALGNNGMYLPPPFPIYSGTVSAQAGFSGGYMQTTMLRQDLGLTYL